MSFLPKNSEELKTYSKNNSSRLIVIDFKAAWCGPCKTIKPFIDYLRDNYKNVDFIEIDIEDEDTETITTMFEIKKVPTFVYYKNDELCNSFIGINKGNIEELVNEYL